MKLLSLVALGAAVPFLAPAAAPATFSTSAVQAASPSVSGVAVAVHQSRTQTIITVRTGTGHLTTMRPRSDSAIVTAGGKRLGARAIRLGDRLAQLTSGIIQDRSQNIVRLRGIVAIAPLQARDPITVQIENSWAIVADADKNTKYSDRSHQTSTWAQLQDSDQVEIEGLYDSEVGEMSSVAHLTRLGPFRRANSSSGKSNA